MNIKKRLDIFFELVDDTRSQSHITYKLADILFMLVCGMISGCTDSEMIIEISEERIDFLKRYTELDNIPCISKLSNILKIASPDHLELCFYRIFNNVFEIKMKIEEREISIDGKTICSTATMKEYERPMHINIKGAIVTLDAMHCQKETAEKIVNNGGDYVL